MKQKLLKSLMLIALLLTGNAVWAYNFESGGIYYKYNGDNVSVTYQDLDYNSYSGDVVIPSTVTYEEITYSVTSIATSAFKNCIGLTSVTIPNSVTSIGTSAFNGCSGLTSVTIPNSVTSIGGYAFGGCTGLTSIIIPHSVTSIDELTFRGCYNLTSIIVESNNTVYDSRNDCNAIIETSTNTLIFGNKYTTLPESVTSIGEYAFSACKGLTNIEIPNTITSIGSYAFYGCSDLTSITIPNSVTELNNYTFWACSNLTSIALPNTLTKIGTETFNGCTKLTSIHIPDSVKSIGNYCFVMCENLSSITIPSSCENIGSSIISDCNKLTEVIVENENKVYDSRNNCNAIIETSSNTLIAACNNSTIPNGVTAIGNQAFSGCINLTTISLPNSLSSIGEHAFSGCENLEDISFPNSLTTIENFAFACCMKLSSIYIPQSVTHIGTNPFYGCSDLETIVVDSENQIYDSRQNCNAIIESATNSLITGCEKTFIPNIITHINNLAFRSCFDLTFIEIPNSVTSIGNSAFLWCSGLTSVTSLNPIPPTCENGVFYNVDTQNITLTVPAESVELYKAANTWKDFGTIVGVVTETSVDYGFDAEDITTLHNKTIDLPINLINVGDVSAFQFDIYLPEGITIDINEDEEYEITLNSDRTTSSHCVSTFKQSNGAIRYACYSNKSSVFGGDSGTTLFTIPLTIAENMDGEYKVQIKDIILSSSDAQGYNSQDLEINITVKPYDYGDSNGDGNINIVDVVNTMNVVLGKSSTSFIYEATDINDDGQINIVDVVGTMNLILNNTHTAATTSILKYISNKSTTSQERVYIEDFTICASESKIIDLNMTNTQAYSAIQFDIVIPTGLTIDYDENEEEFLFETTDRLTKSHSINSNLLSENTIRIGIYSNKNKDFLLNKGALIRIPFTTATDMEVGEYIIEIKNIVLSTSDGQGVYLPDTQTTLVVYPATMTGAEETLADVDANAEYYNLQGVKVAKENLTQGVYIKNVAGKSVKVLIK